MVVRGPDFGLVKDADACCIAPLLTTRTFALLPFLDVAVSSSTCICIIPWYWGRREHRDAQSYRYDVVTYLEKILLGKLLQLLPTV